MIQESLNFLMSNKTVLVIAHRLSTLLSMDRILVFENGSIVEDGSHAELMKKQGLYSKFWHSQNKNFIEL
jgi:ATP-binding cassette subfamily B protein